MEMTLMAIKGFVRKVGRDSFDVYIGRPQANSSALVYGEHYGNPFSHVPHSRCAVRVNTRDEAVNAFREWINGTAFHLVEPERRLWIIGQLSLLKGKTLGCFCAPKRCHGDILSEMANFC
jgi:hypothetical protein